MKGLLDGKKGFLLSVKEVADILTLPPEYFLGDLNCIGEEIIVKLVKREGFASRTGEMVDFDQTKMQERYIFLKKNDFERKLSIKLKRFSFLFCFKEGNELLYSEAREQLFFAMEMLGKENFIWIGLENFFDPLGDDSVSEFIEVEW